MKLRSVSLTVRMFVFRAKSSDQRERVIFPVRQHRFGWRSYRPVILSPIVALVLLSAISSAQEPGWSGQVIAFGQQREQIRSTPIEQRPYRPLHFYGNAVRRAHYHGSVLPRPTDVARGAATLVSP